VVTCNLWLCLQNSRRLSAIE